MLLVLASFAISHLLFLFLPSIFGIWNARMIDQLFTFRSASPGLRPPYDNTVVHIDIDDTSLRDLGSPYLDRAHVAEVISNLSDMGVALQVYDFIFAAPLVEETDRTLIAAAEGAGNAYFGLAFRLRQKDSFPSAPGVEAYLKRIQWDARVRGDASGLPDGSGVLMTFPDLAEASRGLGSVNALPDTDGVLRRMPLVVRYAGRLYPTVPLRVACDYLGVTPERITIRPGKHILLQDVRRPGESGFHDVRIPIDRHGSMIVNYVGPRGTMDHYGFSGILSASRDRYEMEMWRDKLRGKIAVIADVSMGSTDTGPVPGDDNYPLSGILTNTINSLLTESFLRELGYRGMVPIEIFILSIILILSLRFSSLCFSIGTLSAALLYLAVAGTSFLYGGLILNVGRPITMVVLAMVLILVYRYVEEEREKMESFRQRDFIRSTFGRYLSREVVDELLDSPEGLEMGGELREVTFLVCDLRGFTAITSGLSPHEIISAINLYFDSMIEIIGKHRGTVDEFQGDSILVFFGAPLVADDDAQRAIACAIEMQLKMVEVNRALGQIDLPELAMGIGIDTGEVVIGNIGSTKRSKYGAVGSAITATHRIESYTTGGQILISSDTYRKVESVVVTAGTIDVQFKGFDHQTTLHSVTGIGGAYQVMLSETPGDTSVEFENPLPAKCFPIHGKTVSKTYITGDIVRFSGSQLEIRLQEAIGVHTNLRIMLESGDVPENTGIYAKVLEVEPYGGLSSHAEAMLEITHLPAATRNYLKSLRGHQGISA